MTGRWYLVISDEYETVDPIMDDGTGPIEYGCDVLYVKARTAKRAKTLMVRAFRRKTKGRSWKSAPWLWDGNPFRGMKVERIDCTEWKREEAEFLSEPRSPVTADRSVA